MTEKHPGSAPADSRTISRRRFVQGLALGGTAALLGTASQPVWALTRQGRSTSGATSYALEISGMPVNFTGQSAMAKTVNDQLPGPLLRWREGTDVTLSVTNRLSVPTSLHWHGIVLPYQMDGVPGISYAGIAPGETFVYRFPIRQSGTYWYHAHTHFQEQTGLYGPIIIDPSGPERHPTDRDYIVMLNDWTDMDPHELFAVLKRNSEYFAVNKRTIGDFASDVAMLGLRGALQAHAMWNRMRMSPQDLIDVTGFTYTYLMNGGTPADNWTGLFNPGERIRLRFINGSANSYFDVRIPGLKLTVISADGQDVEPITVDEFRIAAAETYDVIVQPHEDQPYTLFAQAIDRSGFARGTLAPRAGMAAPVPPLDPVPVLTHVDMMGAMAQSGPAADGMSHAGHGMSAMEHMNHASMPGMSQPPVAMPGMQTGHEMMPNMGPDRVRAHHARTEYHNPGVAMRVDWPRTNLDDPGAGLRDNGRRVLTYADLHAIDPSTDTREPSRDIELHLTGNMERFTWSFDGVPFSDAKPVHFPKGERLRIILVNDTMMNHPIHLHGIFSELENPDGQVIARKHTVNVQPAQRVTYAVTADNPGRWAYHCHLLYHMEAGMFREIVTA